jgi:hypothetical protein
MMHFPLNHHVEDFHEGQSGQVLIRRQFSAQQLEIVAGASALE